MGMAPTVTDPSGPLSDVTRISPEGKRACCTSSVLSENRSANDIITSPRLSVGLYEESVSHAIFGSGTLFPAGPGPGPGRENGNALRGRTAAASRRAYRFGVPSESEWK